MELDKDRIVNAVAQLARQRDVGHIILSKEAYDLYCLKLAKWHRSRGMKYSTCHDVPLHVERWCPVDKIIGFGGPRDRKSYLILAGLQAEDRRFVESLVMDLVRSNWEPMTVAKLPTKGES